MSKKKKSKTKILLIIIFLLLLGIGAATFYIVTTPQISLNGDKNMEVTMAEGYEEPGATAKFSFKDISSHITIDNQVDCTKVGTYQVIYTVKYLEKTATAERTVSVIDKEPPEITFTDGDTITIRPGQKFVDPGYTAIDDSDGDVTDKVKRKGFVDVFNKGKYTLTYTVKDSYDNKAKAKRTVVVKGEPVKTNKSVIYLTFDDGPSNKVTPKILDTLAEYDVPATFFIINYGSDSKKLQTLKREIKDGHTIAIHGYSHDYSKIYASPDAFMENINKLHNKLKKDTGYDAFAIRFPGGSSNTISKKYCNGIMTKLAKRVQEEGYMYNDWNVDSTDASGNNVPVKQLVSNVKKYCHENTYNIILMHDTDAKGTTAEALPQIIEWGKENGYQFKAMTKNSPTFHHDINN